ncbi:hypothetical protein GKG47_14795 [Lactonifactor sp. BIOML-A3]|uniref:hypothetical protein n=1 Tax=unclassified Lactonifactor TaxID=2636670 RepID=UPI0012AF9554|nr:MULTISPECIES: hypothetical protein [unclassified Lactonifactor]MSA03057.1 hypothetical protein [Lactonifactor sp. BIOML-A5]MSA08787.1 hypothetical protein [Lactonifactor sp. BIOML-A4]MSA13695.1 hypothetical protein [Lactonifactor sp. BIOML-A3]MSA18277.1 hypothetical protein [Lactonifactor sp. BIOML-A2]MSA38519.1 hypothetical protein [Lactonifactor sp. BIOML-A1]
MKKKIVALMLAVSLTVSFTACGTPKNNAKESSKPEEASDTAESKEADGEKESGGDSGTLSAEKNMLSVEVTIPASLLEGSDPAELTEEAEENGVKEVTQNADGSVTMKMTKEAHKELLTSMKVSIDESINELLADKENCPSFDSITYSDDVATFDIKVDADSFGGFEGIYAITFYLMGNIYQALNAVPEEEINTTVNFINKDTGEVIQTGDSASMAEEASDSAE